MRLSDLTDIDRAKGIFTELIGGLLVLIIVGTLACDIAQRLTFADELAFLCFFLLLSPLAYLIRKRRRPPRPERPRGGAERTPVLPPEDGE